MFLIPDFSHPIEEMQIIDEFGSYMGMKAIHHIEGPHSRQFEKIKSGTIEEGVAIISLINYFLITLCVRYCWEIYT